MVSVLHNQVITNTWFKHHPRRLWTWKRPGGNIKNQNDYITINKSFWRAVPQTKTYPGSDCGSDHKPFISTLKVKLKKVKKAKTTPKLNDDTLSLDPDINEAYKAGVMKMFKTNTIGNLQWDLFNKALANTARQVIPKRRRKVRANGYNSWHPETSEERQKVTDRYSHEYKMLDKEIKRKCTEAKESWLDIQCEEIEQAKEKETTSIYKKIKEITGSITYSSSGCIQSKEGTIIVEKHKILERWIKYIWELFHDDRGDKSPIPKNMDGPKIQRSGVHAALKMMKRHKAAGPVKNVTEMITSLEEYWVGKVTDITNKIYDTGEIAEDLCWSIFIALPKKPGAVECELDRTISLLSHITKPILRITMETVCSRIQLEIRIEQHCFVEDTGTGNVIFMGRMISERAIEKQRDICRCFIDYLRAFDNYMMNFSRCWWF